VKSLRLCVEDPIFDGYRIDKYIALNIKLFSRSQIKTRISKVFLNGELTKISKRVKLGDYIEINYTDPPSIDLIPENININILFENQSVIVINKKQGMVVHPGSGNFSGTLVNALLYYCKKLNESFDAELMRPGIVHRLDKDTSGVLIVAKDIQTLEFLSKQFRKKTVKKTYLAIVKGKPPAQTGKIETGIIRDPLHRKRFKCSLSKGRKAITFYKIIKEWDNYTYLLLKPYTGRTHQLRVHMRYLDCPIIGDKLYSSKNKEFSYPLMLHAFKLAITLPGQNQLKEFEAPIPERFKKIIKNIKNIMINDLETKAPR